MEHVENTQTIICGRCATVCDVVDHFCRCCGMPLSDDQMPLKRESHLPVIASPRVPAAVVRAVAVVAAGAVTEIMARRLAREAGRRVTNAVRLPGRRAPKALTVVDQPATISDELYIRRIHMRR